MRNYIFINHSIYIVLYKPWFWSGWYSWLDPGLSGPDDKNISVSERLLCDIFPLVDWASVFMVWPEIAGHPIELYFVNNMKTIYTWCVSIEIKKIYNDILLE